MSDCTTASVVIPCHNAASTVERAVLSALAQTRRPAQIVCVDDGSDDDTLAVLHRLARAEPGRVEVVAQPRAGACAARNHGLRLVTAPYVQFLDADDWLHPEKLAHQLGLVEGHGTRPPDIVAGSFTRERLDGAPVLRTTHLGDPWAALAWVRLGITSANLFRRRAVLRVGGWNEAWASSQEYELMFRMLRRGVTVAFDPFPLTVLYQQAGSITQRAPEANVVRRIRLGAMILRYLRRYGRPRDVAEAEAALFFLVQMRCAYSVERGARSYHAYFPHHYAPPVGPCVSRGYRQLHRALGFELAQRVRLAGRRAGHWRGPDRTDHPSGPRERGRPAPEFTDPTTDSPTP